MAKATYVSNGGTTQGFAPTLIVPASTTEGDRITVVIQTSDTGNVTGWSGTGPTAFTLESSGNMPIDGTNSQSPPAVWVYGKDATADDEANAGSKTYVWTPNDNGEEQVGVLILNDPATFGQFAKNETTATTTSVQAPSVTTTDADEIVYHCALKDAGVAFTGFPSGTQIADEVIGGTNGAGAAMGIVEQVYASPGATGSKTYTFSSEEANGYTFSLVPVILGPPTEIVVKFYDIGGTVHANGVVIYCYDVATNTLEYTGAIGSVTGFDTVHASISTPAAGEAVFTFANGDTADRYFVLDPSEDVYGNITNAITPTQLV